MGQVGAVDVWMRRQLQLASFDWEAGEAWMDGRVDERIVCFEFARGALNVSGDVLFCSQHHLVFDDVRVTTTTVRDVEESVLG